MRLEIVDVFADTPLAGNQLAVVRDAGSLASERMQDIAREMNFSETTFVLSEHADRAQVRIFTPTNELPFAGHPTLGTAWVLGRDRADFTLELPVGPVEVTFDAPESANDCGNAAGICWMSPPQPTFAGQVAPAVVAELVGLPAAQLHGDYPPTLVSIGPDFLLVGVVNETALSKATFNLELRAGIESDGISANSLFIFCPGSATDYSARMLFDVNGLREDPATGSANSGFAVYLRDHCGVAPGRYLVAQGDQMGRPSRIYLDLKQDTYRVGGRVQGVVVGELDPG